ncbi:glycosyltransferase family 87 protein [Legionella cardiaca]|uniref:Glycosyltransferase family 87 protein n=1 Tax=Legionella cardiaca TaxID=1071983 RepID=A0ABY8AQ62_9GAMM|nr:glycosyltransferase family 87 protein [Legionella cardiaca]WED42569.1 glycosyltransferase family 87 protein [Legionella cardiaca]
MNLGYWQRAAFLFLLFTYSLLFYFILTFQQGIDFASFYSASQTLTIGNNPYQTLFATYLPVAKKLAANLNPPIVLILFNPLVQFDYNTALTIWWLVSLFLGLIAAHFTFKHVFSPDFLKKNRATLYLLYLSFFATMMDTAITQLGALLFFCIMLGYHFYLRKNDYLAGLLWGIIIAMKLFPALLFLYALHQKRYKVFAFTLFITLLLSIFPLLLYGKAIYQDYFSMMAEVMWYGDSWNASLYGFLFRVFMDANDKMQSHLWLNLLYGVLFIVFLLWYLKTLIKTPVMVKQSFALTLAMMLFLSPFGWLYYFSLLIFSLAFTWSIIFSEEGNNKAKLLWLMSLFLLNFPMDYLSSKKMLTLSSKLFLNSFYFYGLFIHLYLLGTQKATQMQRKSPRHTNFNYLPIISIIFGFGLLVPILSFIGRLFDIDWSN